MITISMMVCVRLARCTEPYLRLVAEAETPELLEEKLGIIRNLIKKAGGYEQT